MSEVYFIFDECIAQNKIGILSCAVFEDKRVIDQVGDLLAELKHKPMFYEMQNAPHYCEDSYTQKQFILDKLRLLNIRSYIVFKEYPNISDTELVNEELLGEFVKLLILKYIKKLGATTKFKLFFENMSDKSNSDLKRFTTYLEKASVSLNNMDIAILKKGEMNSLAFLPDYFCGSLKDFLTIKKANTNTAGDMIFRNLLEGVGVGYIKFIDINGYVRHFSTSEKAQKVSFQEEFRGYIEK